MNKNTDSSSGNERANKAEAILQSNPFDLEAWSVLIRNNQICNINEARPFYEQLVERFLHCAKFWKMYIAHELKHENFEHVEKLFQRSLINIVNIDLWKLYLNYIKETKSKLPSFREKMVQAYDFTIDKVGLDIGAFYIYDSYILFLKSIDTMGNYAENQRISALRKVYHKAVCTPITMIEAAWKGYCEFENSTNPALAKKLLDDKAKEYMAAKRATRELEPLHRLIDKTAPAAPPQNTGEEKQQVEAWKKLIAMEKSNPLRTDDLSVFVKRVMFTYDQCLLCLAYHPEIWLDAARFLEQQCRLLSERGDANSCKAMNEETSRFYDRAVSKYMRCCCLVYFAYAEFEESRGELEKAHSIYKQCVSVQEINPTLAYIQYMRFVRRTEGIKAARGIFKLAREDQRSDHHIYIAAAFMEYYCGKDKNIAFKIFELGLKKFAGVTKFILAYVKFMDHLNEDNNTRVLFERVLTSNQIPSSEISVLWDHYLEFEATVGDLNTLLKVEKRREQATRSQLQIDNDTTSKMDPLVFCVDKYRFLDLMPCDLKELNAFGYQYLSTNKETAATYGSHKQEFIFDTLYPRPNTDQMLPFKPLPFVLPGAHPVPGGAFPIPPTIAHVMCLLPPPNCFQGPFVRIDDFINNFHVTDLPDKDKFLADGIDLSLIETTALLTKDSPFRSSNSQTVKRKPSAEESDDDVTLNGDAVSVGDVWLSRQQKRAK